MSQGMKNILRSVALDFNKTLKYNASIKRFSAAVKYKTVPETSLRDEDSKINQKGSKSQLEDLLGLRPYIAKEIVLKYKKFLRIPSYNIGENYNICIKCGITKETLVQYPEVLAESNIFPKIEQLKKLPYDINSTMPLLSLTYSKLQIFVANEIDTKRIAFISKLLEMPENKICEYLVRKPFLLSLSLKQLEDNVKLMTGFGITKEKIIRDLWVLRYSTSLIKGRLILAKQNKVETMKTWMVRAQPEIFKTYIKRRSDTKSILGDNSLAEYLSERLECTEEVAKYLIEKQPALQNKSLKKMNEIIDFLFAYGFKPVHIRRVPKILLHSVETTRVRLKELEAQGVQLDTLYMLTKSQRQYKQYYDTLVKTNKS